MNFLVVDVDFGAKDLLIVLPVMQLLGVGAETLLEEHRGVLDDSDCSLIGASNMRTHGDQVSRLMLQRQNRFSNSHVYPHILFVDVRPLVNVFKIKVE